MDAHTGPSARSGRTVAGSSPCSSWNKMTSEECGWRIPGAYPVSKEDCARQTMGASSSAHTWAHTSSLGQPSFETGYAPGMRQPHSSLVILYQLEHAEDPATVRPLPAEVPVHPLCSFLSKSKYALGMRWTFFRPRTRLTYALEVPSAASACCLGKRRYAPQYALNLKLL